MLTMRGGERGCGGLTPSPRPSPGSCICSSPLAVTSHMAPTCLRGRLGNVVFAYAHRGEHEMGLGATPRFLSLPH